MREWDKLFIHPKMASYFRWKLQNSHSPFYSPPSPSLSQTKTTSSKALAGNWHQDHVFLHKPQRFIPYDGATCRNNRKIERRESSAQFEVLLLKPPAQFARTNQTAQSHTFKSSQMYPGTRLSNPTDHQYTRSVSKRNERRAPTTHPRPPTTSPHVKPHQKWQNPTSSHHFIPFTQRQRSSAHSITSNPCADHSES